MKLEELRNMIKKAFTQNWVSDKDKKKRSLLGNVAVLATATTPFLLSAALKGRGAKLTRIAEKALHSPNASKLSLKDAMRMATMEKVRWNRAGFNLKDFRIAESSTPGFADLSHIEFNPFNRTGRLRIGVRSLKDAHTHGINRDMFLHELGHAHEAYKHMPSSVLGNIWRNYIGGRILPYKWNPLYKEELRAWKNAQKLSGGTPDKNIMDAALATYRHGITKNNLMTYAGLGSAGLIGHRFFGREDGGSRP